MKHLFKVTAAIMAAITLATAPVSADSCSRYRRERKRHHLIEVMDGIDLASDRFNDTVNRKGNLVIEITYGRVIDRKGNGRILNTTDLKHRYISYKRVKGKHKGDVIMSVFIYGPDRKAYDDDLARYDWIIDCRHHK